MTSYELAEILEDPGNRRKMNQIPTFEKIFCGKEFGFCLDPFGNAWAFGQGRKGQLGTGSKEGSTSCPINISKGSRRWKFKQISCYDTHVVGLTMDNELYCWGDASEGKMAQMEYRVFPRPTPIHKSHFETEYVYRNDIKY